ncbi:MAG TPA: aldehyde dehydrogenase family protein [Streptosporangiaceae bacterium]|nr:aldehyde dehydrogenase family protein [Streptosporangiaceae bacterium]
MSDLLARAASGYASWKSTDIARRSEIVARVGQLHAERADELGAIITKEMGSRPGRRKARSCSLRLSTGTTPTMRLSC